MPPFFFGDNGDRPAGRREPRKETILTECSLPGFRYRCAGDGDADHPLWAGTIFFWTSEKKMLDLLPADIYKNSCLM